MKRFFCTIVDQQECVYHEYIYAYSGKQARYFMQKKYGFNSRVQVVVVDEFRQLTLF